MCSAVLALASCGSSQAKLPGLDIPLNAMNNELQLYVPPEANSFIPGDIVVVIAENLAQAPIEFANDYGLRLYRSDGDQWIPVDNVMDYPTGQITLYPKSEELLGGQPVLLHPYLE